MWAQNWLQKSEEILQQAKLNDRKRLECLSYIRYYQGWAYFDAGEIDVAKPNFEEARCCAETICLDRFVQVIETSLADVAIYQGDSNIAKTLLERGLRLAEANADRRRIAAIKHSFAKLAHAEGRSDKKRRDATESLEIFRQLGMTTELEEIQSLLDSDVSNKKRARLSSSVFNSNLR